MLLKLKPDNISCRLHEITPGESGGLDIRRAAETKIRVYADRDYEGFTILFDDELPTRVNVYLNNEPLPFVRQDLTSRVIKCNLPQDSKPLFADCYGYVCLEVQCQWEDRTEHYISDYIEVLVRSTEVTESLEAMVKYIGGYYDKYLRADHSGSAGAPREGKVSRLLEICRQIRDLYEELLPVFKANPYRVLDSAYRVDGIEKLRQTTPETLIYMARHPELLVGSSVETAIRYDGMYYIPRKTLVLNTVQNSDNYENQVVIGFLLTVLNSMSGLISDIKRWTAYCRTERWGDGVYNSSVNAVVRIMGRALVSQKEEALEIYAGIRDLYMAYNSYFPVAEMLVQDVPQPTQVFMEEIHYRRIYEMILSWFNFGSVDIEHEEYMMPFAVNSSL